MALSYCEVCGALIRGEPAADLPDGVICEDCYASRRVVVAEEPEAEAARPATVEFGCVYCKSVLRVHAVAQRTKVRCPKCSETFFMNPDGSIEARLEGNTTAIIAKPEGLDPLTPASGTPEGKAGKFTRLGMDANTKTQPLKRPTGALALPIESLDPPDDDDDEPSEPLELLPPEVGPGEVAPEDDPALHASDEGRVDLDAEGLKRKTARFQQQKKNTRRLPRDGVLAERAKEPDPDPADEARRAERAAHEQERVERAAAAQRKAAALEATATRRALAAGALWLLLGLPLIALALVVSMTSRGEGFAVRGQVGDGLERVGRTVRTGAEAVDDLLPAPLRPTRSAPPP